MTGIKDKTAAWLAYIGGAVTGVIVLLFSASKSKPIKTHAWQAILLCISVLVLFIVFSLLSGIASVAGFMVLLKWFCITLWLVLTLMCIISVVNGDTLEIPGIYRLADKLAS